MRFALLTGALALAALALTACPPEGPRVVPRLQLEPCRPDGFAEPVRCGHLEVPEDRARPDGRRLSLKVVVLPARTADPLPDPLYLLAGGPGQSAVDVGAKLSSAFAKVRRKREVVLVDQRGTGGSHPLACEQVELGLAERFDPKNDPEEVRRCLEALDADPRHYVTAVAMDDLDAVREALSHPLINLWGASYGTRAALVYLRRHGDHVRSVILDGVAPLEMRLPLDFPADGQRALNALLDDCAADAACGEAFPDLRATLDGLLAGLAEAPLAGTVRHPRTGEPVDISIGRDAFTSTVRGLLYDVHVASLLPLTFTRAAAGDLDPLVAQATALSGGLEGGMSQGMMLSVVCAEDLPRISDDEAVAAAAGAFMGPVIYESMRDACAVWPKGEVPQGFFQPVRSEVPVLVLSGALDPVTPPRWGEAAAQHLSAARHVVVPGVGHGVTPHGCAPKVLAAFVADPQGELDVACLEGLARPPFFTSFAGPTP